MGTFRVLRKPSQLAFLGFWAVLVPAAITGCSSSPDLPPPCMPPSFSTSVSEARAGDLVIISAPAAACNPSYGTDAKVGISISTDFGEKLLDTKAPMEDSGAFEYSYRIPKTAKLGVLSVSAAPANVDWCDDTGTNNRLTNESDIERTSCMIPVKQLAIVD